MREFQRFRFLGSPRPFQSAGPLSCPLLQTRIPAGFPSPAQDDKEGYLDLNERLVEHPAATYFTRVAGDSMRGAGIHDGDLVMVDRALNSQLSEGDIVLAAIDGDYTLKRFRRGRRSVRLLAENEGYPDLVVLPHHELEIWGVATYVIHPLRRQRF